MSSFGTDFQEVYSDAWVQGFWANLRRGVVGKPLGNGQYDIWQPGRVNKLWVRIKDKSGESTTLITAYAGNAPYKPNYPVYLLEAPSGDFFVFMADWSRAEQFMGYKNPLQAVGVHTHDVQTGGLYDLVSEHRFKPGRVRIVSGLIVYIEAFWYNYGGDTKYFPGGGIDLTAYVPGTSAQHRWVRVGVDPSSNAPTATAGVNYPLAIELTDSLLDNISFSGLISCAGVVLEYGDTGLTDYRRIRPAHEYFTVPATSAYPYQNPDTISEDVIIVSGQNALLVGPVSWTGTATLTVNGRLKTI